jgi:hypothetical protein
MDRVAGLTRSFWVGSPVPSFTSFSDHKKFFSKFVPIDRRVKAYADYIRDDTAWFEDPLKEVRDKFVVHASPRHSRMLGLPNDWELHLTIMTPRGPADKPFARVQAIHVNPLRLSHQIHDFLLRYSELAADALGVRLAGPSSGPNDIRRGKR